jgi:hypothetical protein
MRWGVGHGHFQSHPSEYLLLAGSVLILLAVDKWLAMASTLHIIWLKLCRIEGCYLRMGAVAQVTTSGGVVWSIMAAFAVCLCCLWMLLGLAPEKWGDWGLTYLVGLGVVSFHLGLNETYFRATKFRLEDGRHLLSERAAEIFSNWVKVKPLLVSLGVAWASVFVTAGVSLFLTALSRGRLALDGSGLLLVGSAGLAHLITRANSSIILAFDRMVIGQQLYSDLLTFYQGMAERVQALF